MIQSFRSVGLASLRMGIVLGMGIPALAFAQTQTFSDVPSTSPVAAAADYLVSKGVIAPAAQFKPNDKLTRAQAAKILVSTLVSPDQLATLKQSSFSDVPATAWYMPYAEAARQLKIVDSGAMFNPEKSVTKAAFIKMLLSSKKLDYNGAFSDFVAPIATDVTTSSEWFYPVMRYSIAASMTAVGKDGVLSPSREITRGDMALLYYRLDMYMADRRTQALLSQTETDIGNVLQMLDSKNVSQAEYASNRAILSARGALTSRPNEPLVQGAVKVAKGFQLLVLAYKAGVTGDLDAVLKNTKEAYAAADKARLLSPSLSVVTTQMQQIAKSMADEARKTQATAKK